MSFSGTIYPMDADLQLGVFKMMGTERRGAIASVMIMIAAGLCWAEPTMDWYYISFDNQRQITHQTLGHPQLSDPITTSGGDGDGWHY